MKRICPCRSMQVFNKKVLTCSFFNAAQKSGGVTQFHEWLISAFHLYYCYFQFDLSDPFSVYINIWLVAYQLT